VEPLRVPPEAAGERLDQFLAAHVGSRAQAQRRIEAGTVSLDGAPARKNVRLRGGETIVVLADAIEPAVDAAPAADFTVVYEDDALMIVDKPAGVVVHPAGPHRSGTLSQALQSRGSAGGEP
jgi:23S rRNA pseudouridine1911/1915/1917 synthase